MSSPQTVGEENEEEGPPLTDYALGARSRWILHCSFYDRKGGTAGGGRPPGRYIDYSKYLTLIYDHVRFTTNGAAHGHNILFLHVPYKVYILSLMYTHVRAHVVDFDW